MPKQLILRHSVWRIQGTEWAWTALPNASVVHKMFMFGENMLRGFAFVVLKKVCLLSGIKESLSAVSTNMCLLDELHKRCSSESLYPVSEWTENCLPIGDMERRGETDCSRWVLGTPSKMEIQGCEPSQEACPCSFLAESPSPDLWSSCYHWTAAWFPRTSSWTFLTWAQPLPRVCKCVYSREILTFGFA